MRVAMIGGDRRMLYAAQAFRRAGDDVAVAGFDTVEIPEELNHTSLSEAAAERDIIILPPRPLNGAYLFAPFASDAITIRELGGMVGTTLLFTGCADGIAPYLRGKGYDYAAREDYAVRNAVLTAEAAIALLIREDDGAIFGSRILVFGYGRIGRILCRYLRAMGAHVTVAARREASRAWAQAEGIIAVDYSSEEIYNQRILINTVPSPILTATQVDRLRNDALIMELASSPGGVDADRVRGRGLRFLAAPGLPGRVSPAAAGRIIKDTIYTIIKEENGGKDHAGLCDDRFLLHL